jgi:wyosine [tRNA(Phe)-imidazoG37] synthetase (radical SAM superfamily)
MTEKMTDETYPDLPASTVYGPVKSWRLGASLGVDLLYVNSICSFRCVYCQLGRINVVTGERRVFVPTRRVMDDLAASRWREAAVVTFSGSGEPTLAANLGEAVREVKAYTRLSVAVLTNATLLNDAAVRRDLSEADQVCCKLDAADERTFAFVNRPAAGVTLGGVVEGMMKLRAEYAGRLAVQTMLMPMNSKRLDELAALLAEIRPDEVQLNTPLRRVPREWSIGTRGNHAAAAAGAVRLRALDRDEARRVEERLRAATGLKIVSVYGT